MLCVGEVLVLHVGVRLSNEVSFHAAGRSVLPSGRTSQQSGKLKFRVANARRGTTRTNQGVRR